MGQVSNKYDIVNSYVANGINRADLLSFAEIMYNAGFITVEVMFDPQLNTNVTKYSCKAHRLDITDDEETPMPQPVDVNDFLKNLADDLEAHAKETAAGAEPEEVIPIEVIPEAEDNTTKTKRKKNS
jgi:hypothetical protein